MRFVLNTVAGHRPSPLASTVGIIAAIALTMAFARVLLYGTGNQAASPSPSASALSTVEPVMTPTISASPAASLEPSGSPAPTMGGTGFTTPGASSEWKGFSSSRPTAANESVSQVLKWRGGYVASTSVSMFGETWPSSGLWTSPDGETWTPVTSIDAAAVLVSVAPGGLVAIGVDPEGLKIPRSVWTSYDGAAWHYAGTPGLAGEVVSIAGSEAGIVATLVVTTQNGKATVYSDLIEFSVDGVHWTPESVDRGLATSEPGAGLLPHVQANNGRFFLMGTAAPQTGSSGIVVAASEIRDEMWWSDDGKAWTRTSGSYSLCADFIDFGRDGLLLHTNIPAAPGGTGLALSTDGGKAWKPYDRDGPLGPVVCQGACGFGPDGLIGSNGTVFVAIKNGGKQAWLSYDGNAWSPIPWSGGDPGTSEAAYGGFGGFVVLPRGVLLADAYSAAK